MNLKERIDIEINKKALKTGRMGSEAVIIKLQLTDSELEEFKNIKFDDHYNFEIDNNEVCISFVEEI